MDVLDTDRREIVGPAGRARVTPAEFTVLDALSAARGKVVAHHHLFNAVYGLAEDGGPSSRTIDVFLCHLRAKLAAVQAPARIVTYPGIGHMLDEPAT